MNELITENLYLVKTAIKQLHCKFNSEEEWQEYYQIGCLGLVKATKTIDLTKAKKKYLLRGIKYEILLNFKSNTLKKNFKTISLNELVGDETEKIDLIPSDFDIEEEILRLDRKDIVHKALNKLKNTQYKKFLYEYYGIDTPELNQSEIAQKYGISKQCVQNQIQRGLKILKKELEKLL